MFFLFFSHIPKNLCTVVKWKLVDVSAKTLSNDICDKNLC